MSEGGTKSRIKGVLQHLFGLERYLLLFARFSLLRGVQRRREPEIGRLIAMLPARGTVLDVGACLGTTTLPLARALPRSVVHAFEPHPVNHRVLARIVRGVPNVRTHPVAVAAERSIARLVMPAAEGARLHGLTHVVHETISEFNEGETVDVETVMLDEYLDLPRIDPPLTCIKIDVENFEYYALAGCRQGIERFRPVILCELWDNENRRRVFDLLRELGYSASVLRRGELVPFRREEGDALNFFFLPAGEA